MSNNSKHKYINNYIIDKNTTHNMCYVIIRLNLKTTGIRNSLILTESL